MDDTLDFVIWNYCSWSIMCVLMDWAHVEAEIMFCSRSVASEQRYLFCMLSEDTLHLYQENPCCLSPVCFLKASVQCRISNILLF